MQTVLCEVDQRGIARVTLNNPDKHNAFDDAIIGELTAVFSAIADNPAVRVMLLAATGKSFSAGADLNWMQRMTNYSYAENLRDSQALAEMLRVLNFMPQPTIARVQGAAYGGAVGLISCCDIAIAASAATFALSEVKIGLLPATISPYVINAIGQRAARRYSSAICGAPLITGLTTNSGSKRVITHAWTKMATFASPGARKILLSVAARISRWWKLKACSIGIRRLRIARWSACLMPVWVSEGARLSRYGRAAN